MKSLISTAIVTLSMTSVQAFAIADDGELVEVTAPDLSGSTLPPSLASVTGWAVVGGGVGAASLKQAAMQQAAKTVAERKSKQQEKKEKDKQEEDDFQKAVNGDPSVMQTLIRETAVTLRQMLDNGRVIESTTEDANGNKTTFKDCEPSGPLNPNKLSCTQQKLELFNDPIDGVERYVWSFSVIQGKYNPKHYYADTAGYYPEIVDKQSVVLVIDNIDDLAWQLARVFPTK